MKEILLDYMKKFTDLPEEQLLPMIENIPVVSYPKGSVLIRQGETNEKFFFVLKGMARKHAVDEDGVETTYGFISEQQSIVILYNKDSDGISPYTVSCLEDCVMIVGDPEQEQADYEAHPELEAMTRLMMQDDMDRKQDELESYIRKTPEAMVKHIMDSRPELLTRVPQHQLASYLGMTPESLSRIKRRLERSHLKAVD